MKRSKKRKQIVEDSSSHSSEEQEMNPQQIGSGNLEVKKQNSTEVKKQNSTNGNKTPIRKKRKQKDVGNDDDAKQVDNDAPEQDNGNYLMITYQGVTIGKIKLD